ncbi:MAG: molecular chaperone DnaK, partial [Betaproteobacteria bacterium]
EKEKIEAAIKDVEETLKGDDKDAIEAKTTAMMTAAQKLGEKMYASAAGAQAAGGAAQAEPQAAAGGKADDVVDADYKEVKRG